MNYFNNSYSNNNIIINVDDNINDIVDVDDIVDDNINDIVDVDDIVDDNINDIVDDNINDIVDDNINDIVDDNINDIVEQKYIPYSLPYGKYNKFITTYCPMRKEIIGNKNGLIDWGVVRLNGEKILTKKITKFNKFSNLHNDIKMKRSGMKNSNKEVTELVYDSNSSDRDIIKLINNNSVFWGIIDSVQLYDRDELNMSESSINLDHNQKTFVLTKMDSVFIPILKEKLSDTAVFDGIEANDINNFITHITFKGKIFYNAIINDPDLSLYLCTQFYPIYDWISLII
jgi:hypothetical protein